MQSEGNLCGILGVPAAERVQAHYAGAQTHLTNSSEILRRSSHEQDLYSQYVANGEPNGPTIYSSKGEHFTEVCPSLKHFIDHELKLELKYFGYMEYAYGLEEHRKLFHKIIVRDHQLEEEFIPSEQFQVGCFMNSTRLVMFDLGRLICQELENNKETRQPVVLSFEPGWDYTGVYHSLKMQVIHLPLTPSNQFEPNLQEWEEHLQKANPSHIDLVIINTQHNPTGKQWSVEIVNYLIDLAIKYQSYLLIDDAYYCVNDPRIAVVNTLKIWLTRLHQMKSTKMSSRWIQTRPFGKQYNCNAMGIAAVSSSPDLISKLNLLYWDHNYLNGCVNAQIIHQWLSKYQDHADQFIVDNGLELVRKKDYIRFHLENDFGYPSTSICTGPATSYLLFEVPKVYQDDRTKKASEISEDFSDQLYFATGVMLSGSLFSHSNLSSYVRLHLGSHPDNLQEIIRRFRHAGLDYHMKTKFNSFSTKVHNLANKLWNIVSS